MASATIPWRSRVARVDKLPFCLYLLLTLLAQSNLSSPRGIFRIFRSSGKSWKVDWQVTNCTESFCMKLYELQWHFISSWITNATKRRTFNCPKICVIEFAEKDHDVVVFDGACSDCLRLRLLENSRLVNTQKTTKPFIFNDVDSTMKFTSISVNFCPLLVVSLTLIYFLSVITT